MSVIGEAALPLSQTHVLEERAYSAWWNALDAEDRDEFFYIYQGDEILARFVCALDALLLQDPKADGERLIQLAYSIACAPYGQYACPLDHPDLPTRAKKAWEHDAVQTLLERTRWRETRRQYSALVNRVFKATTQLLQDAEARDDEGKPLHSIKNRKMALDAATSLVKITADEEATLRAERTRRGLERAKNALRGAMEEENPRVRGTMFKALVAKIGPEEAQKLLDEARRKPAALTIVQDNAG